LAKRVESWVVTDEFWQRVEPLIPPRASPADKIYARKPGAGRPPKPTRQVFEAIVYVLRAGCQWKALPKERFGSASAVHKRFLEWEQAGFFEALWRAGLAEYDEMEGIAWRWQSVDGAMMKAPLAQEAVGPNPTDRGKKGSKRHLLVDGRGVPLSLIVTAANVNDGKRINEVLSAIVVPSAKARPYDATSICAPTRATEVPTKFASSRHMATSHTSSIAARKPTSSAAIRRRRLDDGWSRCAIAGSTASANSSYAMRSSSAASSPSTTLLPPSSRSAKCRWTST
jgi:transposase